MNCLAISLYSTVDRLKEQHLVHRVVYLVFARVTVNAAAINLEPATKFYYIRWTTHSVHLFRKRYRKRTHRTVIRD